MSCPKCSAKLVLPPPVESLKQRFPSLAVDMSIDRTQPRCQRCEMRAANKAAIEVDCPPPAYTNPLKRLEHGMKKIRTDLKDDIDPDVMELLLSVMKTKWAETHKDREIRGNAIWKQYWAIWGTITGQEGP